MSNYKRHEAQSLIYKTGLIPVFYHADPEISIEIISAVIKGGCPIIEYTNRGSFAVEVFAEISSYFAKKNPKLLLGAGSIVEPGTAAQYINLGAGFILSPNLNKKTAETCNRRKVSYTPGCATASEISEAESYGCDIVKVFPAAELGGPNFVKSVRAPMPWVSIVPTGGVEPTLKSLKSWFDAGVVAVGMGSKLLEKKSIEKKNWKALEEKVKKTMAIIKKVRS